MISETLGLFVSGYKGITVTFRFKRLALVRHSSPHMGVGGGVGGRERGALGGDEVGLLGADGGGEVAE